MAGRLIESFKNGFYAYVTSPASNGAYAMSFLTIFATIPLLALLVYLATIIQPLDSLATSLREFIFEGLTRTMKANLSPIIDGFLSNAQKLGIIGTFFGMYSSYVFFSALDYWVQNIYGAEERSNLGILGSAILITTLIALIQTIFSLIYELLDLNYFIKEVLNFIMVWAMLSLAFIVLPNDKVKYKYASLISALISLALIVIKIGFIYYVKYSFSYKTIYGSFATVMFLLIWIELCWWLFFTGLNALKVHKS